jgi:hypothetical protein
MVMDKQKPYNKSVTYLQTVVLVTLQTLSPFNLYVRTNTEVLELVHYIDNVKCSRFQYIQKISRVQKAALQTIK